MTIREWIRDREISGFPTFSVEEIRLALPHYSEQVIKNDLFRISSQGIIYPVYKGFYVIIPPHYASGKDYFDKFQDIKVKNVRIVPFLNNMLNVLKVCDLIVTRAGASTIAEITAIGLPSILVPSPYVANNHQLYNAMELVNNKASVLLEEKDFNANNLLHLSYFLLICCLITG